MAASGTWDHMEPLQPKPPPTMGHMTWTLSRGRLRIFGDGHLVAGDVLGGVVDGELFAVPPGDGGVGLHGVVILDGRDVGLVDGDGGLTLKAAGEVAAVFVGGLLSGVLWPAGFAEAVHEVELGRLGGVLDFEQASGVPGLVEGVGDDEGDGLAVVVDLGCPAGG